MASPVNVTARARAIRRAEGTIVRQTAATLKAARQKLLGLLAEADVWAVSAGRQERRLRAIFGRAADVLTGTYSTLNEQAREHLVTVGVTHGRAVAADVERALRREGYGLTLALPTRAEFRALATMTPVRGAVMRDWWGRQRQTTTRRLTDEIRIGYLNGEGIGEMAGRVEHALGFAARQAEALTRTAVNSIANRAALLTYRENDDVMGQYQYVAAVDDRTTEICLELNGQIFDVNDPTAKMPPQHWNCRSTTVPVVNYGALKSARKESA